MVSNMSGNPSVPYFFCQDTARTWPDLIFPKFKPAQIQFQTTQVAFRKRICTNAGCATHKASHQTALNPKNYPIRFVTAQRKNRYAHGFSAFDSAQSGARFKHGVRGWQMNSTVKHGKIGDLFHFAVFYRKADWPLPYRTVRTVKRTSARFYRTVNTFGTTWNRQLVSPACPWFVPRRWRGKICRPQKTWIPSSY
jgi:hypothetical protein